jgi:hypothetical protein
MKFRIHFEIKGIEDSFIVESDIIEDAREIAKIELLKRGVNILKDIHWSEEIK